MIIWNKSFGKINKTKKMWEKNDNKKIWFFHIVRCLVRLLNSFVSDMIGILILKLFSVLLLLFNKMYTLKSVMFIHSFISRSHLSFFILFAKYFHSSLYYKHKHIHKYGCNNFVWNMLANGTFIIYRRLKKVELRKKTMKKKKKTKWN